MWHGNVPEVVRGPWYSFLPSCLFWNLMLTLDRREWLLEVPLGPHRIPSALCPSDGLLWKRPPWWLQSGKGSQELKGDPKYDRNVNLHSIAGGTIPICFEPIPGKAERYVPHLFWERNGETRYAKLTMHAPRSSPIVSEFTLLLLNSGIYNASRWETGQETLRTTAVIRDETFHFCGRFTWIDINSLTGQLLILFSHVIMHI